VAGSIGTPLTSSATRVVLLGAGSLGKEMVIALQRLSAEVVAVGPDKNAPAMQVAHRAHVCDLLDSEALLDVLAIERPHVVVPEAGVMDSSVLGQIEAGGARIVPSALATQMTMNRELLRRLLAEDLRLPTPRYRFAGTLVEFEAAVAEVGLPVVVKPVHSAGAAGHSVVRNVGELASAWEVAQQGGWRSDDDDGGLARVIVEEFIDFDAEIQVLIVRHVAGIVVCPPIETIEENGFVASWQPAPVWYETGSDTWERIVEISLKAISKLPGNGVFVVELFLKGDEIFLSEVIPRPTGAGLVTLVSQDRCEFAMQARAILGLPVVAPVVIPGAARALWFAGDGAPVFSNLAAALEVPTADLRLYGKPKGEGLRRVGVAFATGEDTAQARERADACAAAVAVHVG
jgi:phosphoribosylglycinamide formyltransferase 2